MKKLFSLILWLIFIPGMTQNLNFDIYLIDLKKDEMGILQFEKAQNISKHPGYDNQPSFDFDGESVFYTQMQDSTTDIKRYYNTTNTVTLNTSPLTSEYSPTPFLNHLQTLMVRVEKDGFTQRLGIHFKGKVKIYLPKIDSVGYFCLLPNNQLAAFILSSKNELAHELRLIDVNTQKETFIDDSIGRCIRLAPDSSAIVYVKKSADGKHKLMRYNFHNKSITELCETVEGAEDFLFYDNVRIWMAKENKLYQYWFAAKFPHWDEVEDFSKNNSQLKNITRMNLSPDKSKLVLVAEDE